MAWALLIIYGLAVQSLNEINSKFPRLYYLLLHLGIVRRITIKYEKDISISCGSALFLVCKMDAFIVSTVEWGGGQ